MEMNNGLAIRKNRVTEVTERRNIADTTPLFAPGSRLSPRAPFLIIKATTYDTRNESYLLERSAACALLDSSYQVYGLIPPFFL